jgi:4-hydroxybenzoate polyprenyltransferase
LQANPDNPPVWRTLLILGRISNLPTVWSNCLAGWWLGGGGGAQRLGLLCAGCSFLYVGGMYLNDACDTKFDAEHRRERPIPSGAIRAQTVRLLSCAWLAIGFLSLAVMGKITALLALGLLGCIVVYDVVHKKTVLSPVLMAGCRFLLYLAAASAAASGINDKTLWSALALAAYIIGLSYLARNESKAGRTNWWPLPLLVAPIVVAAVLNRSAYNFPGVIAFILFAGWLVYCLRRLFTTEKMIGRTVAGLLAGIVLVDLLAVESRTGFMPAVFLLLFGMALLLQRFVPAT